MNSKTPKRVGKLVNALSFLSASLSAKIAYYLFTTPRAGRYKPEQQNQLKSVPSTTLTYKSSKIATYIWEKKHATAKTILLVHGWESNSLRWEKFINRFLNASYTVVALDAPAHGNSSSSSFSAILYAEFINIAVKHYKPDVIIGHSVGGMATAIYQSKYQNAAISHLVLLGAPSSFKDVITRYEQLMDYNETVKKALTERIETKFELKINTYSTANKTKNIATKGLIIHDKKDAVIPFTDAHEINNAYTNSKLILTNRLGHALNANKVIDAVIDFISA